MITQDLGIATAYGYAKSKGYTGTEAEFAELMASYASTAQTAIEAADRAVEANTAAQSAKTDASASKTAAQTAAQTATTKASEASQSASTATTKASEASQSASTASAAATSASTSAQTATTAASTATTKASEAAVSANTATTAKTDAETARDAAVQSASEAAASAASIDPETLEHKAYGAYVVESALGAIASFPDGADSIPMKDVLVHIEPVQEGSGDPSPDNIRPITGWTRAKVTRTGKNLADFVDGYGVNTEGRVTPIGNRTSTIMPIRIKSGYRYRFSSNPTVTCIYAVWKGDELVRRIAGAPSGSRLNVDGGDTLYVTAYAGSDTNVTKDTHHPMITLEDDNYADYEPYSGQTYDITFPSEAGTVYGGTLDVTSGVLTVDRAIVDLGTLTWTRQQNPYASLSDTYIFNASIADSRDPLYPKQNFGGILSSFKWVANYIYFTDDCSAGYIFGTQIAIRYDAYTDETAFKTAVTGQALAYELATPITYQLTPQEITSLLGENNVWADTGDSEVEYRADTKMYVDNKIAELQALVLENNGGN